MCVGAPIHVPKLAPSDPGFTEAVRRGAWGGGGGRWPRRARGERV
jgi:hypothetical protein